MNDFLKRGAWLCLAFGSIFATAQTSNNAYVYKKKAEINMPIVQTKYTADPVPVVVNDTVYLFTSHDDDLGEGFEMTMHPFSRNAVAAFDWGGVFLNKRFSRDNNSRHPRYTSDIFELATAITNQTSVNCVAIMPNNLTEIPQFELDFARNIPTTWDETRFVDGYPGKYCVIARRHGSTWYVGGLNGTDQVMTLTLDLPMLTGQTVKYYTGNKKKVDETYFSSTLKSLKVDGDGKAKVTIHPMGGIILQN